MTSDSYIRYKFASSEFYLLTLVHLGGGLQDHKNVPYIRYEFVSSEFYLLTLFHLKLVFNI